MERREINPADATHHLHCIHAIGRSQKYYTMKCIPIGIMDDGRLKLVVFGERDGNPWFRGKQSIRYVHQLRVSAIYQDHKGGVAYAKSKEEQR